MNVWCLYVCVDQCGVVVWCGVWCDVVCILLQLWFGMVAPKRPLPPYGPLLNCIQVGANSGATCNSARRGCKDGPPLLRPAPAAEMSTLRFREVLSAAHREHWILEIVHRAVNEIRNDVLGDFLESALIEETDRSERFRPEQTKEGHHDELMLRCEIL
jgi:hypothetical protein